MGYGDGRTDDFVSGRGFAEAMDNIADTFRQREQNRVESEYQSQIRALQQKLQAVSRERDEAVKGWEEAGLQGDAWRETVRHFVDVDAKREEVLAVYREKKSALAAKNQHS